MIMIFLFGRYNEQGLDVLTYIGWCIWGLSVVFGFLPILILKRRGGVKKGKSYVHTQKLVDTGLYSIIRHPQYTAGILLSAALVLISQDLLVSILGALMILLLYIDIILADRHDVEKFGEEYRDYMKRVPRTNFMLGIIRVLFRKNRGTVIEERVRPKNKSYEKPRPP